MQLALPSALFLSLFVLFQETGVSAELCISSSDTLSGLDTDYSIEDPSKLSIVGFEASISYLSVPGGKPHRIVFRRRLLRPPFLTTNCVLTLLVRVRPQFPSIDSYLEDFECQ